MNEKDIRLTRGKNLCVSCEICKSICPVNAINMEYEGGQFVPILDEETCIECGKCFEVCPGIDINQYEGDDFKKWLTGKYIEGYAAYTKNRDILKKSTSGGVITQLLIELLKKGDHEGAFVLPFEMFKGEPPKLELARSEEELKASSKSKYLPASFFEVAEKLRDKSNTNYAIVGTPCQLKGIKNFIQLEDIDEDNILLLGLFCDKTLNLNFLDYFEKKFSKGEENLKKFDYKNKEKSGWPGDCKLYFDSGRELFIDRSQRGKVKDYFQLERCLYCLDKLNRQADISFGDCYINGKENPERSSIIIRTEKGKKVWEKHKDSFTWEESSVTSIMRSQVVSQKKENLKFVEAIKKDKKYPKLKERKKKIRLGQNNKFKKIKLSLAKNKFKDYGRYLLEGIQFETSLGFSYLKDLKDNYDKENNTLPKNVVIFGGGFSNKGAQAMTFTVVDQMKRRFPIENIYLLKTSTYNRDNTEKENYDFTILPWGVGTAINILTEKRTMNLFTISPDLENQVRKILRNADIFLDISGYAIGASSGLKGSFFNQRYILNILLAKKFKKPYFILPQSIGPFNSASTDLFFVFPLMKKYMKYPEKIYPREPQGKKALKPFTQDNVEVQKDIVLLNDGYNLENIFNDEFTLKDITVENNSVGVIPNNHVIKRGDDEQIYDMYELIVRNLLEEKRKIYLLAHSDEDFYICENIKKRFSDKGNVILVEENMNAIELENMIRQFDFIVGSRYHSIIHAFKNGIPAVVIGWAIKYEELLEDFDQEPYIFDIRRNIELEEIKKSIHEMLNRYEKEQKKIKKVLSKLDKNLVFKDIEKLQF